MSPKTVHRVTYELTGEIGDAIEKLLSYLKDLRRSSSTMKYYLLYLYRFQEYLKNQKIFSLKEIREAHLLSFLSTTTNSSINRIRILRYFFRHLFNEGLLEKDISYVLANYKSENKEILPSVYTAEEIKRIETSVDRASSVGKRNYPKMSIRISYKLSLKFLMDTIRKFQVQYIGT
jgi:site-specific recombinase XerD